MKKKGTSKREKGNKFQLWIRDYLREREWIVRNFPMLTNALMLPDKKRPGEKKLIWLPKDNDVFGCDLVARKGALSMWIQASLDSHIQRRLDIFIKYFTELSPHEILMIWIKEEKGIRIKRVHVDDVGRERVMRVTDVGKIVLKKFTPESGIDPNYFGYKKREGPDLFSDQ